MTISQLRSSQGSGHRWVGAWLRAIRTISAWQERRWARAEVLRLAQVGDYLLRDLGIDPKLARKDPSAAAERFLRR
ncbi:MAG TPA: hypothetical protein VJV39_18900 [Dongiaceae bacterium]|nr:hypothetical protein [Dongiaceae bacterium]